MINMLRILQETPQIWILNTSLGLFIASMLILFVGACTSSQDIDPICDPVNFDTHEEFMWCQESYRIKEG